MHNQFLKLALPLFSTLICLPVMGQKSDEPAPSVESKVGDSTPKAQKIASTGDTKGTAKPVPDEFKPLDMESQKLADSVNDALEKVKKAVTAQNKEDLQKGLDELILRIQGSVTKIETELEPNSRKTMERAQAKARELTSKAGTPALTQNQQKRYADMAKSYSSNAQLGIEIIKQMQDTRMELTAHLKSAEQEKDLIIEEIALNGFANSLISLKEVVDNMQNLSLRIRGMVSGGLNVDPKL